MFFVFYFIKISKFALPGVMLIYERTSKDRKKERKERMREKERERERESRLFKLCRNLPAQHCVAGVQAALVM